MRAWILLAICILLAPRTATAEPVILWEAPDECPSAQQGRAEVARLLRRELAELDVKLSAAVRISRSAAGPFEARISIDNRPERERVLRDERCAVLAHAAAVVVALAIDPMAPLSDAVPDSGAASSGAAASASATAPHDSDAQRAGASHVPAPDAPGSSSSVAQASPSRAAAAPAPVPVSPAPQAPSSAPPQQAPTKVERSDAKREPTSAASSAESARIGVYVAAAGTLSIGIVPNIAPGVAVSVDLSGSGWCAALRLGYTPAQRSMLDDPAGVGGRVGVGSVAVDAGPRFRLAALDIPLVLGLELGVFHASGVGVHDANVQTPLWGAAYLGSGLRLVWAERFALSLRIEALAALRRPRFVVVGPALERRTFHRPEPLAGRLNLAFEVRLR